VGLVLVNIRNLNGVLCAAEESCFQFRGAKFVKFVREESRGGEEVSLSGDWLLWRSLSKLGQQGVR